MRIEELKNFFLERLQEELPGKIAHQEVVPYRKIAFAEADILKAKESGVLVLFYLKNDAIHIVLIQRTIYEGNHSGQISFPGGKKEPNDVNIIQTSLRETREEIGVLEKDIEVLGQLTNVFIPVSNFYVSPVVGFIDYRPNFVLDKREVQNLIELELKELLKEEHLKETKVKMSSGVNVKVPAFIFGEKIIWGATALILNELKHILKEYYSKSV